MGLVGVIATQLWHHTFIDASLADLPSNALSKGPGGMLSRPFRALGAEPELAGPREHATPR
jgi:hypothetical protein